MSGHKALILMFIPTLLWGLSYPLIKAALAGGLTPGLLNGIRGAIFAALIALFFHKELRTMTKRNFIIGCGAGALVVAVNLFQSTGLEYTTISNSAFLTSTYLLIIPVIQWVVSRRVPSKNILLALVLGTIGIMILTKSLPWRLNFGLGDLLSLAAAFTFAVMVFYYSGPAGRINPLQISLGSGVAQAFISFAYAAVFERHAGSTINWAEVLLPLLILGTLMSFVAHTLQVIAQRYLDPTVAGLVLMQEGLIASVFAVIIGEEPLSVNLVVGGGAMVLAMLLTQLRWWS